MTALVICRRVNKAREVLTDELVRLASKESDSRSIGTEDKTVVIQNQRRSR
jgi:hypothetical protein